MRDLAASLLRDDPNVKDVLHSVVRVEPDPGSRVPVQGPIRVGHALAAREPRLVVTDVPARGEAQKIKQKNEKQ